MRFKNYINRYNKKNRIYSEEELLAMTLNDLLDNEPSILAQDGDIGIPSYEELRQSPNTRWIDTYTNAQGQKDGGFFGSIPEYNESFLPNGKIEPFVFNPNPPYMMSMAEGEPEAEPEESPIVLEGGVEENVYLPEEDDEQESEPSVYIPDEEESEERQKTPYDLSDEDLADILQSIIKAKTTVNTKIEPILEDSFPTISQIDMPYTPPVSLPQLQTSLNQEELKEMYKKLLEELRKMLRASNVYKNGTYMGGASQIFTNNLDNIFSRKMNNANNVLPQEFTSEINNNNKQNFDAIYENLLINPIDLPKYRKQKEHFKEAEKLRAPIKIDNNSITSPFGMRYHPIHKKYIGHKGIDLKCKAGTEVRASLPGIVEAAENQKGYGYVVVINHGRINGKELKTKYAHLSKFDVVKGMQVNSQQKIGLFGGIPGTLGAGSSTGEHLHFEVLEDSLPVDPVKYFKNE